MMYRHKLYESSSAKNKTIGLVINSLFAKSDRESQHSKRVSELSEAIAIKMGFPSAEVNRIRVAGLMHDIGKIGIPEHILNKTSALTSQEWEEMRRHPETGYRILATASEFIDISTIILEHHERWDGLGYPRGLAGEAISIQARIIHVADAFDAMTSERSYKRPMEIAAAIQEIRDCAGTHFDPEVVKFFESTWYQS
jgi:putative nucleotidyltransferase with HDIG domain